MPLLFVTQGPYVGTYLELDDKTAKAALKDKWAVEGHGEDVTTSFAPPPYVPSLQKHLDSLNLDPVTWMPREEEAEQPELAARADTNTAPATEDSADATGSDAEAPAADAKHEAKPAVGGTGKKGK